MVCCISALDLKSHQLPTDLWREGHVRRLPPTPRETIMTMEYTVQRRSSPRSPSMTDASPNTSDYSWQKSSSYLKNYNARKSAPSSPKRSELTSQMASRSPSSIDNTISNHVDDVPVRTISFASPKREATSSDSPISVKTVSLKLSEGLISPSSAASPTSSPKMSDSPNTYLKSNAATYTPTKRERTEKSRSMSNPPTRSTPPSSQKTTDRTMMDVQCTQSQEFEKALESAKRKSSAKIQTVINTASADALSEREQSLRRKEIALMDQKSALLDLQAKLESRENEIFQMQETTLREIEWEREILSQREQELKAIENKLRRRQK